MTDTRTATRGGRRGSLRVLQPPRLRLGLSTGALYPMPTEDVPDAAARAGLFDLEIMLQTPGEYGTGFIRELSTLPKRRVPRACSPSLATASSPALAIRAAGAEAAPCSRAQSRVQSSWVQRSSFGTARRTEMRTPAAYPHFIDAAAERGAACAAAGLRLAIENVSWCALATVRDVLAFSASMKELDPRAERVGFAFDPFQAEEAGANPFMVLSAMEDRVFDVHLE